MAALQVLQGGVCDQGAVVQFDHLQTIVSAGAAAEVPDAIIGDQLTVRQTLQEKHSNFITQLSVGGGGFDRPAHTHQNLQTRAVDRQLYECSICDLMQKQNQINATSTVSSQQQWQQCAFSLFVYLHTFF